MAFKCDKDYDMDSKFKEFIKQLDPRFYSLDMNKNFITCCFSLFDKFRSEIDTFIEKKHTTLPSIYCLIDGRNILSNRYIKPLLQLLEPTNNIINEMNITGNYRDYEINKSIFLKILKQFLRHFYPDKYYKFIITFPSSYKSGTNTDFFHSSSFGSNIELAIVDIPCLFNEELCISDNSYGKNETDDIFITWLYFYITNVYRENIGIFSFDKYKWFWNKLIKVKYWDINVSCEIINSNNEYIVYYYLQQSNDTKYTTVIEKTLTKLLTKTRVKLELNFNSWADWDLLYNYLKSIAIDENHPVFIIIDNMIKNRVISGENGQDILFKHNEFNKKLNIKYHDDALKFEKLLSIIKNYKLN